MNNYKRSHEPIAWSLFGGGGMTLAFLTPALFIITAVLLPFVVEPSTAYALIHTTLAHPLGKLVMWVAIMLPLYHTAHRLYHGLHDLHIEGPEPWMLLLFYGGATVLSALAAYGLLLV
ncbi:MAG: fumarate reductase subunit D [Gammaproteobacteria bacterium]|nr:MAG: fumarate reductase subunit D [Gammaproteobacteria bacterium]